MNLNSILLSLYFLIWNCAEGYPKTWGTAGERIYYTKRIEVKIQNAPFMATLRSRFSNSHSLHCGASIIHTRFLVSAAHCADRTWYESLISTLISRDLYVVSVGTDTMKGKGQIFEIEKMFTHPKFANEDYDVAVVKLAKDLVFGKTVQPIAMANSDLDLPVGTIAVAMGFGQTQTEAFSNELLMVKLPIFDHNKCAIALDKTPYKITDRMICAGGEKGRDSCYGDSGGPLIYNNQLVGIVSWGGMRCGIAGQPGVYTNVANVRSFIDEIIQMN